MRFIGHYFKIAFRNISRQKSLSLINILGLSIGLACFSLFLLYTANEFSYDGWHVKASRIYRVNEWVRGLPDREPGGDASVNTTLGPALKNDFSPDVEDFVRIRSLWGEKLVKTDGQVSSTKLSFADPSFFKIFSFPLIAGTPGLALKESSDIVLTRDKAIRIFGHTDVVGRRLEIKVGDRFEPFRVSAVAENIPGNSSIHFDVLGNFAWLANDPMVKQSEQDWNMTIGIQTFVLLRPGSRLAGEPEEMTAFRRRHKPDEAAALIQGKQWDGKGLYPETYQLQPLRTLHTDTRIDAGPGSSVDPKNIWMLLGIAGAVLLIACINFTTLAIGRSVGRSREIGVRKVLGSRRKQVVWQFLVESLLFTLLSAGLALMIARLFLPQFNSLSDKTLSFSFASNPVLTGIWAATILLTALLAGSYPALALSRFKPVEVLKSRVKVGGSNIFTKSLVSLQFVLSIGLILSTVIILRQLHYMRSKDLGFDKENVIQVNIPDADAGKIFPLYREALRSHPFVAGVSGSNFGLGEGAGEMGGYFEYKGKGDGAIEYAADPDYLSVMGMRLVAGRNFDASRSMDTTGAVIVNQALLDDFGIAMDKAIGAVLQEGQGPGAPPRSRVIIGVVRNFNFEPLHSQVRPQLFFMPASGAPSLLFVRVNPGDLSTTIGSLGKEWARVAPGILFDYSFLNENINRFYSSETRLDGIFAWAGGISIFLACLGLFGLAILAATNRIKEIGIRKVLGASVPGLVGTLTGQFLKLVLIALVIASPLAWYFMHKWLEGYAYRIDISPWIFVGVGVAAMSIAACTLAIQAIRAAMANPIKSLRTE